MAKTWREKLEQTKGLPKIEYFDKNSKNWKPGRYVLPAPLEVDQIMRSVPKGKLITIDLLRQILAEKHGADFACPITVGIFSWIAANAAEEARTAGAKRITPYWRTLKSGGILNQKYPGGAQALAELLRCEGHTVVRKGRSKELMVEDFEKKLIAI